MNWELFKQQCNNEQIQNYGVLEKDIEAFKIVRIISYGFTPETYHSCFRTSARFGADIGHKDCDRYTPKNVGEDRVYYRDCVSISSLIYTLGIACWEDKNRAISICQQLSDNPEAPTRRVVRIIASKGTRYIRSTVNGLSALWLEELTIKEEVY